MKAVNARRFNRKSAGDQIRQCHVISEMMTFAYAPQCLVSRCLPSRVNRIAVVADSSSMATSDRSTYPPPLTPEQEQFLISTIKDWSIQHGLAVRPPATFVPQDALERGVLATNAPVTLFPSLFPKALFEEARAIQTSYNRLYAEIARDEEWLGKIMEE